MVLNRVGQVQANGDEDDFIPMWPRWTTIPCLVNVILVRRRRIRQIELRVGWGDIHQKAARVGMLICGRGTFVVGRQYP